MKKNCFLWIIVFLSATVGFAQSSNQDSISKANLKGDNYGRRILINKFADNWDIAFKIGPQAYMGEYCLSSFYFADWWTFPAMDFNVSKWGTNSVGMSAGFTISRFRSLYMESEREYATFATPNDPNYGLNLYQASGWMGNAYVQAIFDLCNMFGGYKPDRKYSLVAAIGGGLVFPLSSTTYKDICASFNAGLINKFKLTKHLYLDLAIRGTLHDDNFNGISYYSSGDERNLSVDATIGATVGISYRFNFRKSTTIDTAGKRVNEEGWTSVEQVVPYTETYQHVEKELVKATDSIATVEAALAEVNTQLEEIAKDTIRIREQMMLKEPMRYRHFVNFTIDKWDLNNREKVGLIFAADFIKNHPNHKFMVMGYADIQTSNREHNQMLSENRTKVVYDCLVNEFDVNPAQLETSSNGGVDYMFFSDEQCSRSVIIISIDEEE